MSTRLAPFGGAGRVGAGCDMNPSATLVSEISRADRSRAR